MADAQRSLILMRLSRKGRATPRLDPADMGTAFGMEYVLDQAAAEESLGQRADDPGTPSTWLRRWLPSKAVR